MKLLSLLIVLVLFNSVQAQIHEGLGIDPLDGCDFESDCGRITLDTAFTTIWQIGDPDKAVFDTTFSPINCVVTDTALTYPVSNHSTFEYTVYAEEGGFSSNSLVEFHHRIDSDTLIDGGFIEFRYDPEGIWRNVIDHQDLYPEFEFYSENLYGETDTIAGGENGFSGFSDEWVHTRLQWIWYYPIRESYDTLYLRFNFMSDAVDTERDGWMIDDILLSSVNFGGNIGENELKYSQLSIYPNPSSNFITVNYDAHNNEIYALCIMDVLGQNIMHLDGLAGRAIQLNIAELPKGIYEVQIQKKGELSARQKLVVQ